MNRKIKPASSNASGKIVLLIILLLIIFGGGYYLWRNKKPGIVPSSETVSTEKTTAQDKDAAVSGGSDDMAEEIPPTNIDIAELEKSEDLQSVMQKRKEQFGVDEGIDLIVRSDETVTIGDITIPMQDILDQINLMEGNVVEKDIAGTPRTIVDDELIQRQVEKSRQRMEEIEKLMRLPHIKEDEQTYQEYSREYAKLDSVVSDYREYRQIEEEIGVYQTILESKAEEPEKQILNKIYDIQQQKEQIERSYLEKETQRVQQYLIDELKTSQKAFADLEKQLSSATADMDSQQLKNSLETYVRYGRDLSVYEAYESLVEDVRAYEDIAGQNDSDLKRQLLYRLSVFRIKKDEMETALSDRLMSGEASTPENLEAQLDAAAHRFNELSEILSDSEMQTDTEEYRNHIEEYSRLRETVSHYEAYRRTVGEIRFLEALILEDVPEIKRAVAEKSQKLKNEKRTYEKEYIASVLPGDAENVAGEFKKVRARHAELLALLGDTQVLKDPEKFQAYIEELAHLSRIVEEYSAYFKVSEEDEIFKTMLSDAEIPLENRIDERLSQLSAHEAESRSRLAEQLLPDDPDDIERLQAEFLQTEQRYTDLKAALKDPQLSEEPEKYAETIREYIRLSKIIQDYHDYRRTKTQLETYRELASKDKPALIDDLIRTLVVLRKEKSALEHEKLWAQFPDRKKQGNLSKMMTDIEKRYHELEDILTQSETVEDPSLYQKQLAEYLDLDTVIREYNLVKDIDKNISDYENLFSLSDDRIEKQAADRLHALKIRRKDIKTNIADELISPENQPKSSVFGIYIVQPNDNIWNIHFRFLRDFFGKRGITVLPKDDEPKQNGTSSGIGKLLKFSETMVYIYNIRERQLEFDLNIIHPMSKIVIFNMGQVFSLLNQIDYKNIDRIQYDGERIWIPAPQG